MGGVGRADEGVKVRLTERGTDSLGSHDRQSANVIGEEATTQPSCGYLDSGKNLKGLNSLS